MTVERFFEGTPMARLTRGGLVEEETAAFIYPNEEKRLLYRISEALRVTSYDKKTVYLPGRDYAVKNGRLVLPPGSAVNVITPERYYSPGAAPMLRVRKADGSESPCFVPAEGEMARYQIRVTYTHADTWDGFTQPHLPVYGRFLQKTERGENVTLLFYGDSITYGADASLVHNAPPFEPPYPVLFTNALARLYGGRARFAPPGAPNAWNAPLTEKRFGERGTLTCVNTAVGGWTSADGARHTETHLIPQIKECGCDLLLLGFGMNDGLRPPEETAANCETIVRTALSLQPDAGVLLIATILPNPDAVNGWNGSHPLHEAAFEALAKRLNEEGVPCGVARVTSASAAVLQRKAFIDYTGNNINHPNDFFSRVYASSLLQAVVGYDTHTGRS